MTVESWKSVCDVLAVALLFLTFLAGTGVLFTGNIINGRQTQRLRTFDADLTAAKTELATQQTRAAKAEGNIALATQHAADADAKAEGFRLDIAKANEESEKAQAQVAGATAEAAKASAKAEEFRLDIANANERAARLEIKAEDLKQENLKTESLLESEKHKRIELAVSLLPRNFRDQSGAIAELQKLPAKSALIEYLDTPECLATAEQINLVLSQAGWTIKGVPVKTVWPSEGVGVSSGRDRASTPDAPNNALEIFRLNETIGNVLVNEMNKSGIESKWLVGSRGHKLPFGVMYISVGFRPDIALEKALKELGPQEPPTPLGEQGTMMGGNKMRFAGDNP